MKDLFPGQNLEAGPFTIITLAQRTDNDMSKWSNQVPYSSRAVLGIRDPVHLTPGIRIRDEFFPDSGCGPFILVKISYMYYFQNPCYVIFMN
jgi:hypothetical protein